MQCVMCIKLSQGGGACARGKVTGAVMICNSVSVFAITPCNSMSSALLGKRADGGR